MENGTVLAIVLGLGALILFMAWDRWIIPSQARRYVLKLLRTSVPAKSAEPRQSKYAIAFNAEGFIISSAGRSPHPVAKMQWSQVQRVTVFKEDWFTVDCICLAMGAVDDKALWVDEDMAGWQVFVEALPNYLPGCTPWNNWFSDVAFPAFATNLTEVYNR
jgi:hypothetical protein